jgi:aryl-alcohol dehydrogenase-like predicted oxidoreductase
MVKTLPFGDAQIPVPGFGAMGISFGLGTNLSLDEAEPVLLKAIELGCTFWDTAVSYAEGLARGCFGKLMLCRKGCLQSWGQRKAPRGFH